MVSYKYALSDHLSNIDENLSEVCSLIPLWNEICKEDPPSCQLSSIEIENLENTIYTLTRTMFSIYGVCELQDLPSSKEIISRCHKSLPWSTGEGINKRHRFIEEMMQGYRDFLIRNKRFIISGPIVVATAIRVLSTSGAVTASYAIAVSESSQISEEQYILRNIASSNAISNNLINNNVSIGQIY